VERLEFSRNPPPQNLADRVARDQSRQRLGVRLSSAAFMANVGRYANFRFSSFGKSNPSADLPTLSLPQSKFHHPQATSAP
jgi:hypothetical protein